MLTTIQPELPTHMPEDLSETIEDLFSLAIGDGMPLEVRKLALTELTQGLARGAGSKISSDASVEYASRVKLFLALRILNQKQSAAEQLVLLSQGGAQSNSQRSSQTVDEIDRLAKQLFERKQCLEAVSLLEAAVDFGEALLRRAFPQKAHLYSNHATVLFLTERYAEAEVMRRSELLLRQQPTDSIGLTRRVLCEEGLADAIAAQGRLQEASVIYVRVYRECRKHELHMNGPAMKRLQQKIQDSMRVD